MRENASEFAEKSDCKAIQTRQRLILLGNDYLLFFMGGLPSAIDDLATATL